LIGDIAYAEAPGELLQVGGLFRSKRLLPDQIQYLGVKFEADTDAQLCRVGQWALEGRLQRRSRDAQFE
jgi:hypothetical protein